MDRNVHKYLKFSHCYSQQFFCETLCSKLVWFWHQIVSSPFCCYKFRTFPIVFPKTKLLISLKKSFSKSFWAFIFSLVFMSIYGFSHASWLNLLTPRTFFNSSPWFKAWFYSDRDIKSLYVTKLLQQILSEYKHMIQ